MIDYKDRLSDMINDVIGTLNPQLGDDDLCDAIQDYENRSEAIEYLKKVLDTLKEE